MNIWNLSVFDDTISGASATWYTPAEFNDQLGTPETITILAWVTNVTGTSPTLQVQVEHSGNGQNWVALNGSPEISSGIVSNTAYYGATGLNSFLTYVRLKVTLGGTSPQCRLKLSVTGRAV